MTTVLECLGCLHDEESRPLIDRAFGDERLDLDSGYKAEVLRLYEEPFEKVLGHLNVDPMLHFAPEELRRYKPIEEGVPPPALAQQKTGRNDPCPCGRGKKYKKCCLSG